MGLDLALRYGFGNGDIRLDHSHSVVGVKTP